MAVSGKTELVNLIPTVWSTTFFEQLKTNLILGSLFSREYEGEIAKKGDTVKVNQIVSPDAETLAGDESTFTPGLIVVNQFELKADKQTIVSAEITDLAQLQSESFMEDLKKEMMYKLMLKIEQDIIALCVAEFTAVNVAVDGAFSAADFGKARTTLSLAKVPKTDRYALLDPNFYGSALQQNSIISSDFAEGKAFVDQEIGKVLGMKVAEHDALAAHRALVVHKSAVQLVMQKGVNFKISDMHSSYKLGYLISCDVVWGQKVFEDARGMILKNAV